MEYISEVTNKGIGGGEDPIGFILASHRMLACENKALRLLEGMDALTASALGTFLMGGDIPATIDAARGALVRRALEAERDLKDLRRLCNFIDSKP